MKYNGIIERKLSLLSDQVLNIRKNITVAGLDEFEHNWLLVCAAERSLQVAIEIMIDIAERIIALKKAGPAASAADAMQKLELLGIIKSAKVYEQMVKFRNLIVHEYEIIDHHILYEILTNHLDDFEQFKHEIDIYNK
jgi:uncharacterized protein YutE (UPF0331/DUF86 family)